jgi:hypothetical protein
VLREIYARLDLGRMADRMIAAYRAEIPVYAELSPSILDGRIRTATIKGMELFAAWIGTERPLGDRELGILQESARADARDGIPLEDLLHAYRIGGLVAWQQAREVIHEEEWEAQVYGSRFYVEYAERVATEVSRAYLEERERLESAQEDRYRALLVALTASAEPIPPKLIELARQSGFAVEDSYRPFAAAYGAADPRNADLARELRAERVLAITEGQSVAGLAPAAFETESLQRPGITFAVGEALERDRLGGALDDLRLAVEVGLESGSTGEVGSDQYFLERLLRGSPRVAGMVQERVFKPLDQEDGGEPSELLKTVAAFLASNLERKTTAERLGIHPNTLDYRLRQFRELTGLDLSRTDDRTLVILALRRSGLQ